MILLFNFQCGNGDCCVASMLVQGIWRMWWVFGLGEGCEGKGGGAQQRQWRTHKAAEQEDQLQHHAPQQSNRRSLQIELIIIMAYKFNGCPSWSLINSISNARHHHPWQFFALFGNLKVTSFWPFLFDGKWLEFKEFYYRNITSKEPNKTTKNKNKNKEIANKLHFPFSIFYFPLSVWLTFMTQNNKI